MTLNTISHCVYGIANAAYTVKDCCEIYFSYRRIRVVEREAPALREVELESLKARVFSVCVGVISLGVFASNFMRTRDENDYSYSENIYCIESASVLQMIEAGRMYSILSPLFEHFSNIPEEFDVAT